MPKIFKTVKEAEDYYRNNPSKPGDRTNIFGNKPPRKARRDYEHELQVRCIQWFDENYPDAILFAIPNGGHRHKATAGKLKAEGVRAGVPDLFLAKPLTSTAKVNHPKIIDTVELALYAGLFIEMKVKPNKPTEAQLDKLKGLELAGYMTKVIYTFEEFKECIISYFNKKLA